MLHELPASARPREKLLARGASALADAELLALLLGTGLKGKSVLSLSQDLLDRFGGLAGLMHADLQSLQSVKGLGPARRAELAAVLEIARRTLQTRLQRSASFEAPEAVKAYLQLQLAHLDHEAFAVLFLDAQHRLIRMEILFHGTLTQASVYPREVVKRALALGASALIMAHNHPSGVAEPSRADELLTQQLRQAMALVEVRVLDHIVVAAGHCVSMAERGLI
ncbi:MAG TPA: DNA repair protein RadC [Burkholderiaceae bacterium]|nr:DNA repair protein RadC [Burkholderiaceae bacterium]